MPRLLRLPSRPTTDHITTLAADSRETNERQTKGRNGGGIESCAVNIPTVLPLAAPVAGSSAHVRVAVSAGGETLTQLTLDSPHDAGAYPSFTLSQSASRSVFLVPLRGLTVFALHISYSISTRLVPPAFQSLRDCALDGPK